MNHGSRSDGEKSLSHRRIDHALEGLGLVARFGSLVDPSGTLAAVASGIPAVKFIVKSLNDRQAERSARRARLLLEDLGRRVETLEKVTDPPLDLYEEMLLKAIADEDERKIPFYSTMIAWVVEKRPDSAIARRSLEAVSTLCYPEIRAFISWANRGWGRFRIENGWNDGIVLARLKISGVITQEQTVTDSFITHIGVVLSKRCSEHGYSDAEWEKLI